MRTEPTSGRDDLNWLLDRLEEYEDRRSPATDRARGADEAERSR